MRKRKVRILALLMLLVCTMTVGMVSADAIDGEHYSGRAYIRTWRGWNVPGIPGKTDIYKSVQTYFRILGNFSLPCYHSAGREDTLSAGMSVSVYRETAQQFSVNVGGEYSVIPGVVTVSGQLGYSNSGLKGESVAPDFSFSRNITNRPAGYYKVSLLTDYDFLKFQSADGKTVSIFGARLDKEPYLCVMYSSTGLNGTWIKD